LDGQDVLAFLTFPPGNLGNLGNLGDSDANTR